LVSELRNYTIHYEIKAIHSYAQSLPFDQAYEYLFGTVDVHWPVLLPSLATANT
jgi:hypothetical protein